MQLLSRAKPPSGGSDHDHLRFDRSLAQSGATSFYALIPAKIKISLLDCSSDILTTIILFVRDYKTVFSVDSSSMLDE